MLYLVSGEGGKSEGERTQGRKVMGCLRVVSHNFWLTVDEERREAGH